MSDKKETFTLFGVELGTCISAELDACLLMEYCGFKPNEIGVSFGLSDSWCLVVDLISGEITSYDSDLKPTPINHSISLGMNVPVIGNVGE